MYKTLTSPFSVFLHKKKRKFHKESALSGQIWAISAANQPNYRLSGINSEHFHVTLYYINYRVSEWFCAY